MNDTPSHATLLAARHLDATEGPVQIGSTVDSATRSAITQVLKHIAAAHHRSPAAPDLLDEALAAQLGRPLYDTLNRHLANGQRAEEQLDEARSWARHGYEIGQKHCSWTDHGVAPAWLTEGWPPHIDSCEHLREAARYDETLTRVRALLRTWVAAGGPPLGTSISRWVDKRLAELDAVVNPEPSRGDRYESGWYRKKALARAVQLRWTRWNEVCELLGDALTAENPDGAATISAEEASDTCGEEGPSYIGLFVRTAHGTRMFVRHGDWIVPEPASGQFYPVKPEIFADNYEPAAPPENG